MQSWLNLRGNQRYCTAHAIVRSVAAAASNGRQPELSCASLPLPPALVTGRSAARLNAHGPGWKRWRLGRMRLLAVKLGCELVPPH